MPTDRMPTDRMEERWSQASYRRHSGPGPQSRDLPPGRDLPPRRGLALPRVSQRQLMVGAGAALALGLVLGMWARPNFGTIRDTDAAERAAVGVPVEVNRPPPPQPVVASGKLEVLSPDVAAANRQPARPSLTQALGLAPPPPLPALPEPQVETSPRVAALTTPAPRLGTQPPEATSAGPAPGSLSQARAGFDCAGASGLAEQMVCSDPDLAAADREMSRAYRRALRAEGSSGALRADQRDWLGIREDAAHRSRRALAQVYQQRIDELNAAADEAGPPDDGY